MGTGRRGGRVAPAVGRPGGGSRGSGAELAPEESTRRPAAQRLAPASAARSSTPTNRAGGGQTLSPAASRSAELSRRYFLKGALGAASWLAFPRRLLGARPPGASAALAPSPDRYPPIIPRFPHVLPGGDWTPRPGLPQAGRLREIAASISGSRCPTLSAASSPFI